MSIETLWQQFTYHLKVKRRSPNTLANYDVTRRTLNRFLEAEGLSSDLETLTISHLRGFLLWLDEQGLGPGGIHAHARSVKAVFNWAEREEIIVRNPAKRLELPAMPKERQPTVTIATAQALQKAARRTDQPLRDTAIILTFFDTGLRVHELTGLILTDLQFDRGLIRVFGKGAKERYVPVGSRAMSAISAYIRRGRRPRHAGVLNVFLSRSGDALTRSGVSIRLAKMAQTEGIDREACAPHAFRRGFAVEFLRNGGDVFTLQQIMGHSSLDMTRRYVTFLDDDLKAAHLRFSPVDRLRTR